MMTGKELEQIYNEAYKAVYWTAFGLLKNEADAEDIVQDTFVTLIESYDSIKDKSKVTSWLKKTAANKCLDRIKLAKTDNMDEEFFDSVEAVPEDFLPDSIIESEDARRIVMDIINNKLSDDIRRTLILFYFDDMSTKEIADALGIPQGTVSWRLNFAKKTIKKEVEKYEEDNKTKLFGMAAPFLSQLFIKEAEQVPFKAMPAKLISLSASTQASNAEATTKIAASAAKKGTGIMINKGLVGGIAAVVAVGTVVGITVGVLTKKNDNEPKNTNTTIEETEEVTVPGIVDTIQEETVSVTTSEVAETSDDKPQPYSIKGMSADETVDHLLMLCKISTGDSVSAYPDRFMVAPRQIDENKHIYLFKGADVTNCIKSIEIKNIGDDNGAFVTQVDSTVTIKINTDDQGFADALYDQLYNTLESYSSIDPFGTDVSDKRDGLAWRCSIDYYVEVSADEKYDLAQKIGDEKHYYKMVNCSVNRTEHNGEYSFTITLPIN